MSHICRTYFDNLKLEMESSDATIWEKTQIVAKAMTQEALVNDAVTFFSTGTIQPERLQFSLSQDNDLRPDLKPCSSSTLGVQ